MTKTKAIVAGAAALAICGTAFVALAKDHERHGEGRGMHGMMHGYGMMGARFCGETDSVALRMTERLEQRIKPTDAQKAEFDALKAAAQKAEATIKAACPSEAERADRSPPARLATAEKRMTAALEAIKTIRPPFDALYAKLDDTQRDNLRWMGGHNSR